MISHTQNLQRSEKERKKKTLVAAGKNFHQMTSYPNATLVVV